MNIYYTINFFYSVIYNYVTLYKDSNDVCLRSNPLSIFFDLSETRNFLGVIGHSDSFTHKIRQGVEIGYEGSLVN